MMDATIQSQNQPFSMIKSMIDKISYPKILYFFYPIISHYSSLFVHSVMENSKMSPQNLNLKTYYPISLHFYS